MTQKGKTGMGSHKHGTSGHATKSPRLRMQEKMEAEKNIKKSKDDGEYFKSISEIKKAKRKS